MESEKMTALLHDMLLARAFEERAAEEYSKGNIAGFLHLYPGEEAVAQTVVEAVQFAESSPEPTLDDAQAYAVPERVAAREIPTPYNSALEAASIPRPTDIIRAARKLCAR